MGLAGTGVLTRGTLLHGQNIELARHELQKARDAQTKLIQLRERLLAAMVEGVQ